MKENSVRLMEKISREEGEYTMYTEINMKGKRTRGGGKDRQMRWLCGESGSS